MFRKFIVLLTLAIVFSACDRERRDRFVQRVFSNTFFHELYFFGWPAYMKPGAGLHVLPPEARDACETLRRFSVKTYQLDPDAAELFGHRLIEGCWPIEALDRRARFALFLKKNQAAFSFCNAVAELGAEVILGLCRS